MKFGVRAKDAPPPSDSDAVYLRSFKPGDTTVRFLEETDEWITFWEHYTSDNKSYPCTGDRSSCPGCTAETEKERKASLKYGTTVFLVGRDIYLPMRIPVTVHKKMVTRAQRNNGTILTREYTIIRDGQGFDTEYDVEAGSQRGKIDDEEVQEHLIDIQEILKVMWTEIWGEPESDSTESEAPPKNAPAKKAAPKRVEKDEDDDVEEITESDLRAMKIGDLRILARKHGVDSEIAELGTKMELIDAIMDIAAE